MTRSLEIGDRQREAVQHHHAGRGGQTADHRQQRDAAGAGSERQRQHRQIAVDRRRPENIFSPAIASGATNRLIRTR